MTRTKKSSGHGNARRAPSPAPSKPDTSSERRTKGDRRDRAENRREFERFSPTQRPSDRRRSERRVGAH
ncbi:MAG TPA: hypothetical protein VGK26_11235 [Thermoanaerobaculia bacterium]|jgi:hypothetical protein